MIIFVLLQKLLSPSVFPQMEWKSDILQSNCNCKSHLWGNVGGWGRRSNGDHLCPQKTERFHYFGKTTQVDQPSAFTCFSYYLHFFPKTISMSCGNGNKPLDMWIYLVITSWISWTNNQRSRLLVMIRLWWCFPGARNWLMSAAFRNGGAFSFLPPLPPASVKLFPSICYYPQKHLFTHFWDIFDTFLCVCLTHQRMLDKQWKWVLHVASIQRVPQHGKPITQIIQGGRRGRVIICFSGCLVVANHLGVGGAIRCWIREINYLCLAVSSELYQVANCRKKGFNWT